LQCFIEETHLSNTPPDISTPTGCLTLMPRHPLVGSQSTMKPLKFKNKPHTLVIGKLLRHTAKLLLLTTPLCQSTIGDHNRIQNLPCTLIELTKPSVTIPNHLQHRNTKSQNTRKIGTKCDRQSQMHRYNVGKTSVVQKLKLNGKVLNLQA
jgi:hypothetical protein